MNSPFKKPTVRALLAGLLGVGVAIVFFTSSGHDDSHITFWPAWTLAEFGEIVNHSGARVEQSSSLLQTVLLALVYRLSHVPLPWLGYLLAMAAGVLVIVRLPVLAREFDWEPSFGALLVLATAPAFAYWELGMLESSLFTYVGIEFIARVMAVVAGRATAKTWVGLALWTGALSMVRPEAGVVAISVLLAHLVLALFARHKSEFLRAALASLIGLAWFGAVMGFRLSYFGSPFPRPVAVKVGRSATVSLEKLETGFVYLVDRFSSAGGAFLLAGLLVGLGLAVRDLRRGERRRLTPILFLLAYLSFILFVGGDWMAGWRFVGHVEPLFLFFLLLGLDSLRPGPVARRGAEGALVVANCVAMLGFSATVGTGRPLWTAWQVDPAVAAYADPEITWPERANQVHARDAVMVDDMDFVLDRILGFQEHVSILSGQAGLVMYYAAKRHFGKLTFYDYRGLSSNDFSDVEDALDVSAARIGLDWTIQDVMTYGMVHPDERFRPDVIFEISRTMARHMRTLGYTVVYAQSGMATGAYESPRQVSLERGRREADKLGFGGEAESGVVDVPVLRPIPDEAVRERIAARIDRRDSFFTSNTEMYQFIAVRDDLLAKAGLVSVTDSVDFLGLKYPASRQYLVWADARRPYQRFLLGRQGQELPDPIPVFKVSPWSGTLFVRQSTTGAVHWKGLRQSHGVFIDKVEFGGRELREGIDYSFQSNGAFDPGLRILEPAGVTPGDRVLVSGITRGPEPVELKGVLGGS